MQCLRRQGRARQDGDRARLADRRRPRASPARAAALVCPATRSGRVGARGGGHRTGAGGRADRPRRGGPAVRARAAGGHRSAYRRTYGRDHAQVVGGYVEVDPAEYADWTAEWIAAAGAALRPGGYLAVVTGAQQAARVQVAAEDVAGLTYVNSIAVRRPFGLYSTRRYVHAHHRVTLMTRGPLDSPQRFFDRPAEMPRGRTGQIYAVDVWTDIPDERRPGLLRYDNALHPALVSRLVRSTTAVASWSRPVPRKRHHPGGLPADPTTVLRRGPQRPVPVLHDGSHPGRSAPRDVGRRRPARAVRHARSERPLSRLDPPGTRRRPPRPRASTSPADLV